MTQPRPTAPELLEAVRTFLVEDLMPDLEGRQRFHARVASNVLAMVERELRLGPAAAIEERDGLVELLGDPSVPAPAGDDPGRVPSVEDLARELATRIRGGAIDIDDPQLLDHLRRTATDDVAIANPRWLDRPDDGAGAPSEPAG